MNIQELTSKLNSSNPKTAISASCCLGDIIRGNFVLDKNQLTELVEGMVQVLVHTRESKLRTSLLDNIFFALSRRINLRVSCLPILKNTNGFLLEHYRLLMEVLYFSGNKEHWQAIYSFLEHENWEVRKLAVNITTIIETFH